MVEQIVELEPSESRVVTFEIVPMEARSYQVLVNGLSDNFRAIALPTLDGRFVIAYAWWEGLPSRIQILSTAEWPANAAILTSWKVENTGNVAAEFRVEFMGQSGSVSLNPAESGFIEISVSTDGPGSYTPTVNLYANETLVDSFTISLTTVSLVPRKPDYLNGALVGDILYYSNGIWSKTRSWYYNMRSLALFPIKNTGSVRCPVGIDFMGAHEGMWLTPGQFTNWEIGVQVAEGTHTYPYYIWVRDPDTGIEYVVDEGNLTITGIYF